MQRDEEAADKYDSQVKSLQEQLDAAHGKSAQLMSETKRKADVARKLLTEKDDEIRALKGQLVQLRIGHNGGSATATTIDHPERSQEPASADAKERSASPPISKVEMQEVPLTPVKGAETPRSAMIKKALEPLQMRGIDEILSSEEVSLLVVWVDLVLIVLLLTQKRIFHEKPALTAAFNEEMFRRAVLRENELMESIRVLKNEVHAYVCCS